MDCREVQERIIEGQVAPGLLRHLASCRDCEAFIRFHDRLLSPSAAPQAEPGPELDAAVLRAARERLATPLPRSSGGRALTLPIPEVFRRRVWRFAAAALLVVGLTLAGLVAHRARQAAQAGATESEVAVAALAWSYDPFETDLLSAGVQQLEQHFDGATTGWRQPSVEDELDKCAIELLLQEEEGAPDSSPATQPAAAVMGSMIMAHNSAILCDQYVNLTRNATKGQPS